MGCPFRSGKRQILGADKFRFEKGFAVLKQHGDHLPQVIPQFIKGYPLRMGAREPRNVSDQKTRRRVPFDYSLKVHIHTNNDNTT